MQPTAREVRPNSRDSPLTPRPSGNIFPARAGLTGQLGTAAGDAGRIIRRIASHPIRPGGERLLTFSLPLSDYMPEWPSFEASISTSNKRYALCG
jgi:hypothetical protein